MPGVGLFFILFTNFIEQILTLHVRARADRVFPHVRSYLQKVHKNEAFSPLRSSLREKITSVTALTRPPAADRCKNACRLRHCHTWRRGVTFAGAFASNRKSRFPWLTRCVSARIHTRTRYPLAAPRRLFYRARREARTRAVGRGKPGAALPEVPRR